MGRLLARIRLAVVWLAMFSCFSAGWNLAEQINERLYVIVVYGWDAMARQGLRVTKIKPRIVVSNGDRAPEIHGFILFVASMAFGIILCGYGWKLIDVFTGWMGRRVDLLAIGSKLRDEVEGGLGLGRGANIVVISIAAPAAVSFFLLIFNQTPYRSFLNYAVVVVGSSVLLRVVFLGSTGSFEKDVTAEPGRHR